jgi:hypothetical protein
MKPVIIIFVQYNKFCTINIALIGYKLRDFDEVPTKPTEEDYHYVDENDEITITCADGFIDNMFEKKSVKTKCECSENEDENGKVLMRI